MTKRELILFSIWVFISFTILTLIFVISVKAENMLKKIEDSYKEKPSGYVLKCTRYSHVLGGEVCSEFEIYSKVKVEE